MIEKTFEETRHMIDALRVMLVQHSEAVDGIDRKELRDLAVMMQQTLETLEVARGRAQFAAAEVFGLIEAVATAGCVALQTLGGRLALNEGWGDVPSESGREH